MQVGRAVVVVAVAAPAAAVVAVVVAVAAPVVAVVAAVAASCSSHIQSTTVPSVQYVNPILIPTALIPRLNSLLLLRRVVAVEDPIIPDPQELQQLVHDSDRQSVEAVSSRNSQGLTSNICPSPLAMKACR